eukprot:TRINITY_DN4053_c0_g1_i1.p1 TRINITY_DN4053_c0_g1~~TRINITY_DN4053_c0_g1_i1.p1  ORF type:complete len:524 (-),score=47.16 TRINITY_DN4053_c0_g1_i1:149-1720(-)
MGCAACSRVHVTNTSVVPVATFDDHTPPFVLAGPRSAGGNSLPPPSAFSSVNSSSMVMNSGHLGSTVGGAVNFTNKDGTLNLNSGYLGSLQLNSGTLAPSERGKDGAEGKKEIPMIPTEGFAFPDDLLPGTLGQGPPLFPWGLSSPSSPGTPNVQWMLPTESPAVQQQTNSRFLSLNAHEHMSTSTFASTLTEQTYVSNGGSLHLPNLAHGITVTPNGIAQSRQQSSLGGLASEDLEILGTLGSGSSASVKKVRHKTTKQIFALKIIRLGNPSQVDQIKKELIVLYHDGQKSPHIVNFYGAYSVDGAVHMLVEAMAGSLADILARTPSGISEDIIACIARPALDGLDYLHHIRRLVHRDMKPHNILFGKDGRIKITDFGVTSQAEKTPSDPSAFVGTVGYMSLERLSGGACSYAADVWSMGITLLELYLGRHPLQPPGGQDVKFWAVLHTLKTSGAPRAPDDAGEDFKGIIASCLHMDEHKRPSTTELLNHPFLRSEGVPEDRTASQRKVAQWLRLQGLALDD